MDFEKKERRQSLKVIISEAIMVLTVIITVTVLAFVVSGYWLNSDFEVKRQGLLQIASVPTGADVEIDGSTSWLQRTNTSKVLTSGEHDIVLSKEGYDTWSKKITISEGLLYRIHYPRLFLKNRSIESLTPITGATFATISPNRELLLIANNTTKWTLIRLSDDRIEQKKIDIGNLFSGVSLAPGAAVGLFDGSILSIEWSHDSGKILFKNQTPDIVEWTILNLDNNNSSINITKEFGANFDTVKIYDHSANTLLATQSGNLRKVDVPGRLISSVIAENVEYFSHHNNTVIFSAALSETLETPEIGYYLGWFRLGDNRIERLDELAHPAQVVMTRFYEDRYILTLVENKAALYNFNDFTKLADYEIEFTPTDIKVGHGGEFFIMSAGSKIAALDMETKTINTYNVEGETFGWLDDDMIYTAHDGELIVYDYDGLNRRSLAKNVSSHFPIAITSDKFLYYFSDDTLTREWLIPR